MLTTPSILKGLLRGCNILFAPSCLICDSPSLQSLCHRCQLPDTSYKSEQPEHRCPICYERLLAPDDCLFCKEQKPYFNQIRYLWEYRENVRDFCVVLKYKPSLKLIEIAAQYLSNSAPHLFPGRKWDYIVPIPSSRVGFKKRGFNHIDLIAAKFKRYRNIDNPILSDALKNRFINRRSQASLSNSARLRGVKTRYKLSSKYHKLIKGKRILLIDDVTTTGATLNAAAFAIRNAGRPASIDVLTICRSPAWQSFRSSVA